MNPFRLIYFKFGELFCLNLLDSDEDSNEDVCHLKSVFLYPDDNQIQIQDSHRISIVLPHMRGKKNHTREKGASTNKRQGRRNDGKEF